MDKMNRKIIIVLSFFLVLFALLILYMTYFQQFKAKKIADNEYNSRLWVDENKMRRGPVLDRDEKVLAQTQKDKDGKNIREFPYGVVYGNITGYNSKQYGTSGLEKSFAKALLNINEKTPLSDLKNLVSSTDIGNTLKLTTSSELQEKAYDLLEGRKGAIVLMNPKTGEIYAMSSRPSFDPNRITEDWDNLVSNEASPLINRAAQGMYTPGSIFKVITASAILQNKQNLNLEYQDNTGKITIDGYTLSNYGQEAYGRTDLKKALINSSNVYFAKLGTDIGKDKLKDMAYAYFIGRPFNFDLPIARSVDGFEKAPDDAHLATASFGQGDTLVSPLNMAMMMSAVANRGVMVNPYLVSEIISPEKKVISKTETKTISQVLSEEDALTLMDDLKATADQYDSIHIPGVSVAAKTGTAEIKDKKSTNAWIVAAAPVKNPKFVVAVILEDDNSLGEKAAGPLANQMLKEAFRVLGKE